jgi:hypothetical protein
MPKVGDTEHNSKDLSCRYDEGNNVLFKLLNQPVDKYLSNKAKQPSEH